MYIYIYIYIKLRNCTFKDCVDFPLTEFDYAALYGTT
jgi:hypothetical protein